MKVPAELFHPFVQLEQRAFCLSILLHPTNFSTLSLELKCELYRGLPCRIVLATRSFDTAVAVEVLVRSDRSCSPDSSDSGISDEANVVKDRP